MRERRLRPMIGQPRRCYGGTREIGSRVPSKLLFATSVAYGRGGGVGRGLGVGCDLGVGVGLGVEVAVAVAVAVGVALGVAVGVGVGPHGVNV